MIKLSHITSQKKWKTSFIDYAMSVIVSRCFTPDVRDGFKKPVHRRILYSMNDLGNA